MPGQSRPPDQQPPLELSTDFLGESRHEFVAKLAYKLWEQRGRPFGSPEVDWFAAEQAVYASLAQPSQLRMFFGFFALIFIVKQCVFIVAL
jgi:Protein of unknown function (DUF2934)